MCLRVACIVSVLCVCVLRAWFIVVVTVLLCFVCVVFAFGVLGVCVMTGCFFMLCLVLV